MTSYEPALVAAPAVLPVSLEELKQHLRVDHDDEDGLIGIYLNAAVTHLDGANGWLGRSIVAQTWSQAFDVFAGELRLGVAPVSEISGVVYLDGAGSTQTVDPADYVLVNGGTAPGLRFSASFSYPVLSDERPALTVTFVSGYGDDTAAPFPIKAAIMLIAADLYHNREAKLAAGAIENVAARMLLDPFRTRWIA